VKTAALASRFSLSGIDEILALFYQAPGLCRCASSHFPDWAVAMATAHQQYPEVVPLVVVQATYPEPIPRPFPRRSRAIEQAVNGVGYLHVLAVHDRRASLTVTFIGNRHR
jgi:hypothetical protein